MCAVNLFRRTGLHRTVIRCVTLFMGKEFINIVSDTNITILEPKSICRLGCITLKIKLNHYKCSNSKHLKRLPGQTKKKTLSRYCYGNIGKYVMKYLRLQTIYLHMFWFCLVRRLVIVAWCTVAKYVLMPLKLNFLRYCIVQFGYTTRAAVRRGQSGRCTPSCEEQTLAFNSEACYGTHELEREDAESKSKVLG